jgi:hypothetical protein
MRRTISFLFAIAILAASSYAIYELVFVAERFKKLWLIGAGTMCGVSLYWLWEDFVQGWLRVKTAE